MAISSTTPTHTPPHSPMLTPSPLPESTGTASKRPAEDHPETPTDKRARTVALTQGSSTTQRTIKEGMGKTPVSRRALLNRVTREDLGKARQYLQLPGCFIELLEGCDAMRVAKSHEGFSTASDPDDFKSALGITKALFTTNPDFPVVMILHVNTARKGPRTTQAGAESLYEYIKADLAKSGIDASGLHFGAPTKDYRKTSVWVTYGTDNAALPNPNPEGQVLPDEFQPVDDKTHFVVCIEGSTEGFGNLKPDTLGFVGDNDTYTSTNSTYSAKGQEESESIERNQQARAEKYVQRQLGFTPNTPEYDAALQKHQARHSQFLPHEEAYDNSLTYASLLEILGPDHKQALDKALEMARETHVGGLVSGKSPNSFYINRAATVVSQLFSLKTEEGLVPLKAGEFKNNYVPARKADLDKYSMPVKDEKTGKMVPTPATAPLNYLNFNHVPQIASAVKFVVAQDYSINMHQVMEALKRAKGVKLVEDMNGRPLLNRQLLVDYVMQNTGNLDALQEAAPDYKTSMALLLNEKTENGDFKISAEQLAGAVALHLRTFEAEFNKRFPMINTKKEGIPTTIDSFVTLVESKEGGFANMVLPDYDGINSFGRLYPEPEDNTDPARMPVVMFYAALSLGRTTEA